MAVKRISRRSYSSLAKSVTASHFTGPPVVVSVARRVKAELQSLCSTENQTIFRCTAEQVKHFSWEAVWHELEKHLPTLMKLLKLLVKRPLDQKPLMCFIASAIIKQRSYKMCFVQKAISVLLYGNGTNKSVRSQHLKYVYPLIFTSAL